MEHNLELALTSEVKELKDLIGRHAMNNARNWEIEEHSSNCITVRAMCLFNSDIVFLNDLNDLGYYSCMTNEFTNIKIFIHTLD